MELRRFGNLGVVSPFTLGGEGTGQVWAPTSHEEGVAAVKTTHCRVARC